MIAIDRETKETKIFHFIDGLYFRVSETTCPNRCPQVIKQMDYYLRTEIETIVRFYIFFEKKGYLIVFDIDGQLG